MASGGGSIESHRTTGNPKPTQEKTTRREVPNREPQENKDTRSVGTGHDEGWQEPIANGAQDRHNLNPRGRDTIGKEGRVSTCSTGSKVVKSQREESEKEDSGTLPGQHQGDPEMQREEESTKEKETSEPA
jgi:hypothetical protein